MLASTVRRSLLVCLAALMIFAVAFTFSSTAKPTLAQDVKQITVTYMQSGTYDKAAEALAVKFEKDNGVKVKVVSFPWAVLRQNNTNDLLTGAGQYDAMSGGYYLSDVYDKFATLDDYITKSNFANGMIPGLLDIGKSEWYKGHHVGIPYGIDSYGLMVNNDLLKQAGVDPTFKTWDDFLAACKTIVAKLPGIACLSHSTGNPEQIGAFFFSGYDSYYVNKDGKFELDKAKAVAVAKLLPDLWKYLPPNGAALSFDEAEQLFADGKAAMLVDWPSFSSKKLDDKTTSKVAGHWSQVNFPGAGFPWLSLWQQFIPANAKSKDISWKWISTFAGEAQAKDNYVTYGINSVWLSTYQDTDLAAAHAHQWPAMLEGFKRAKNPPLSGEAQDFLTNTMVQVATGQVTADAAIDQINAKWATLAVPASTLEVAVGAGMQEK
ncbi:MAG TPA: extracellular solute-binding protein [Aggregatilineales bacterium]|nr:extracellular solute-binding protein [Aggregatilineales bacterium]